MMPTKKYLPILALLLLALVFPLMSFGRANAQSDLGQVGLVIQFLDGRVEKKCISISKDPFSGYDALSASGYAIIADFSGAMGAAICKIAQQGCSADNCFCNTPNYWAYWRLGQASNGESAWLYSTIGASQSILHAGDVDGWRFGEGIAPSEMPAFADICQPATQTPTFTHTSMPASPTWTAQPVTFLSQSTSRPTAWATAVMLDQPTSTRSLPMAQPTRTPVPSFSLTTPTASSTPLPTSAAIQPAPTQAPEESSVALAAALASPTPASASPSPLARQTKPGKKAAATQVQAVSQPVAVVTADGLSGQLSPVSQNEKTTASKPAGVSTWLILLGGLAGIGSWMFFALLLVGGLVVIYLKGRR